VDGFLPIFFLLVVLKIPVLGALWLVWWASREPDADGAADDSGGSSQRWNPRHPRPRGPHSWPPGGGAAARRPAPTSVRPA